MPDLFDEYGVAPPKQQKPAPPRSTQGGDLFDAYGVEPPTQTATAPAPEKSGIQDAVSRSLKDAGFDPSKVDIGKMDKSDSEYVRRQHDATQRRIKRREGEAPRQTISDLNKLFKDRAEFLGKEAEQIDPDAVDADLPDSPEVQQKLREGRAIIESSPALQPIDEGIERAQREVYEKVPAPLRPVVGATTSSVMGSASLMARVSDAVGLTDDLAHSIGQEASKQQRMGVETAVEGGVNPTLASVVGSATRSFVDMFTLGRLIPAGKATGATSKLGKAAQRINQQRGMIGAFTASEMNRAYVEGSEAGLEGADLHKYGLSQGAIEGVVSSAFSGVGLGGIEKTLLDPAKQGLRQGLKKLGITAIAELPEENIIELASALNSAYQGVDPEAANPENLARTAFETTLSTLLTVGLAEGVAQAGQGRSPAQAKQETGLEDTPDPPAPAVEPEPDTTPPTQPDAPAPVPQPDLVSNDGLSATFSASRPNAEQNAEAYAQDLAQEFGEGSIEIRQLRRGAGVQVRLSPGLHQAKQTLASMDKLSKTQQRGMVRKAREAGYAVKSKADLTPEAVRAVQQQEQNEPDAEPETVAVPQELMDVPVQTDAGPRRTGLETPAGPAPAAATDTSKPIVEFPQRVESVRELSNIAANIDPDEDVDSTFYRGELGNLKNPGPFVRVSVPVKRLEGHTPSDTARTEAMAEQPGTSAPPVIAGVRKDGSGNLEIIDGNNRATAARMRGDRTVTAYIPVADANQFGLAAIPDAPQSDQVYRLTHPELQKDRKSTVANAALQNLAHEYMTKRKNTAPCK